MHKQMESRFELKFQAESGQFEGYASVFHVVDSAHDRMAPGAFARSLNEMKERGIRMIVAPAEEFAASNGLNLNVLPTAPNKVIMISGFPKTKAAMEAAGCEVETFEADALCIACEGGPTCLTRPVLRVA